MLRLNLDALIPVTGTWYAILDKPDGSHESVPVVAWGSTSSKGADGAPRSQVIGLIVDPNEPTQVVLADEVEDMTFTGYSTTPASNSGGQAYFV